MSGNKRFERDAPYTAIRLTVQDGTEKLFGTGFIVRYPFYLADGTHADEILLLVSNKHVLKGPSAKITFGITMADSGQPIPGRKVVFDSDVLNLTYYEHPNPDVDLACLGIATALEAPVYFRSLGPNFLESLNYDDLYAGDEVMIVGYPAGVIDDYNNTPILRKGWFATVPHQLFGGKEDFLVDAGVFPGSSGSPVYTVVSTAQGPKFKLAGVIYRSYHASNEAGEPTEQLGLGIAMKQHRVQELIDHVSQEIRDAMAQDAE